MSTALNPGDVMQSTFVLKNRDNGVSLTKEKQLMRRPPVRLLRIIKTPVYYTIIERLMIRKRSKISQLLKCDYLKIFLKTRIWKQVPLMPLHN